MSKISKNLKVLALILAVSHGMLQVMLRWTQQNHSDTFLSQSGRTPQPDYRLIIVHENQEQDWTKGPTMVHWVLCFGPRDLYLWLYTDLMAHSSRGPILLQYRCLQGRKCSSSLQSTCRLFALFLLGPSLDSWLEVPFQHPEINWAE